MDLIHYLEHIFFSGLFFRKLLFILLFPVKYITDRKRNLLFMRTVNSGSYRGPSNLHKFRAHHPPTFTGGGDPMVVDHWFIQIEKVLEAMKITSDTTRIRLDVFQLEMSEAQIWLK